MHPAPQQLAERSELWWDDGTAVPEWFVDRKWPQGLGQAAMELGTVLLIVVGGGLTYGYMLNDKLRVAAPRWEHGIPYGQMKREFGHKYAQYGISAKYEDDDDEEEEEEE